MGLGSSNLQEENYESIQEEELEDLLERVLEMSSGVLNQLDRITEAEKDFLCSYTQTMIESKIDYWFCTMPWLTPEEERIAIRPEQRDLRIQHLNEITKYMKEKIFKEYVQAYGKLESLMKAVEKLTKKQRKTQLNLLRMKPLPLNDRERCERKLAQLSSKVVNNLRTSLRLEVKSIELRREFLRVVRCIDRDIQDECRRKVRELIVNDYEIME